MSCSLWRPRRRPRSTSRKLGDPVVRVGNVPSRDIDMSAITLVMVQLHRRRRASWSSVHGYVLSLVVFSRYDGTEARTSSVAAESVRRIEPEDLEYEANWDRNLGERTVAREAVGDKDNSVVRELHGRNSMSRRWHTGTRFGDLRGRDDHAPMRVSAPCLVRVDSSRNTLCVYWCGFTAHCERQGTTEAPPAHVTRLTR